MSIYALFFQDQAIKDLNLETVKVLLELIAEIPLEPSIVISFSFVSRKNIIVLFIVETNTTYTNIEVNICLAHSHRDILNKFDCHSLLFSCSFILLPSIPSQRYELGRYLKWASCLLSLNMIRDLLR